MKQAYIKYILGLLLFGSNGVISGFISLNSYEIVLTRTILGSAFLILLLLLSRQKLQIFRYKREIPYMLLSGIALAANWMFLFEGCSFRPFSLMKRSRCRRSSVFAP